MKRPLRAPATAVVRARFGGNGAGRLREHLARLRLRPSRGGRTGIARRGALGGMLLSLLALAAVRGSGGGPPLYDGVCAQPKYVTLGAKPPPPSLSDTLSADTLSSTFERSDQDTAPQAQIIVAAGSLAAPPAASAATLTIIPVNPPGVEPTDGSIDGNVYDFEVTSDGKRLHVIPGHVVTIGLSAATFGGAGRKVEHFDGTTWSAPSKTVTDGCGITYDANSTTLGLFALVVPVGSSLPGSGGAATALIVIALVLFVLAAVLLLVRTSRRRSRERS
jgi:hypothetical protein